MLVLEPEQGWIDSKKPTFGHDLQRVVDLRVKLALERIKALVQRFDIPFLEVGRRNLVDDWLSENRLSVIANASHERTRDVQVAVKNDVRIGEVSLLQFDEVLEPRKARLLLIALAGRAWRGLRFYDAEALGPVVEAVDAHFAHPRRIHEPHVGIRFADGVGDRGAGREDHALVTAVQLGEITALHFEVLCTLRDGTRHARDV